jgi:hypothetical protein
MVPVRTFAQPLPTDPRQLLGWDEKKQQWIQNRDQTMALIRTWNIEVGNGEKLHAVTQERDALKLELAKVTAERDALACRSGLVVQPIFPDGIPPVTCGVQS